MGEDIDLVANQDLKPSKNLNIGIIQKIKMIWSKQVKSEHRHEEIQNLALTKSLSNLNRKAQALNTSHLQVNLDFKKL